MLKLIKNIEGNFITNVIGDVNSYHSISAEVQKEDFIQIYGFTGFLQNLSKIENTSSYGLPALFGFSTPPTSPIVSLDFSTCNKKASWYNMRERPEYMMGLICGIYHGSLDVTISIDSFIINGKEYVTTPIQKIINAANANWVRMDNSVISGCTYGGVTGWTYTDFVDFLNETFSSLGLDYRAKMSYVEKNVGTDSNSGFYITYPKDDEFYLATSSDSGSPVLLTYYNGGLYTTYPFAYSMTNDVTYYCDTDTIVE